MIHRAILSLLCALGLALVLPGPARADVVRQAGDWLLVCDALENCTIVGAPDPDRAAGYPRVIVTIVGSSRADASLRLTTFLADAAGAPHAQARSLEGMSLAARPMGPPLATFTTDPRVGTIDNTGFYTPDDAIRLAQVMARHDPAWARSGMGAFAAMPQGDLAGLLRVMDQRHALAEPAEDGDMIRSERFLYELFPRDQVDDPLDHPLFARGCGDAPYRHMRGYALDHSTVPTLLVHLTCGARQRLFMWTPSTGGAPRPLDLLGRVPRQYRQMEAHFDTDVGVLTVLHHPTGRTDCGVQTDWGWIDGEGFMRLAQRIMPRCRGVQPHMWPAAYVQDNWIAR